MATAHHGSESNESRDKREKELREAMDRFTAQVEGRARREYTRGRLNAEDDGSLAFAIAADPKKNVVIIDFGKPVTWIGLPPDAAVELINNIKKKVQELGHPVVISI